MNLRTKSVILPHCENNSKTNLNFCSFHDYKTICKIPMTRPSWPPCPTPIRRLMGYPMGYPTTQTTASPGRPPKTPSASRVQIQSWITRSKQVQARDPLTGGLKCKLSARAYGKWLWMGHCLTPWNPCGVEEILSVNQIIMRGTVLRCIMSRIVKEVIIRSFFNTIFALHFSE